MSNTLDLSDVEILIQLQNSLQRFSNSTQTQLSAVEKEVNRNREWLEERRLYWIKQTQIAETQVKQCELALRNCQTTTERDSRGDYQSQDCRAEKRDLENSYQYLRKAKENYKTAQIWKSRFEQSATEFEKQVQRVKILLSSHAANACSTLTGYINKYQNVHGASSIESINSDSIIRASQIGEKLEALKESLGIKELDEVLDDNSGKKAEELTRMVLEERGLPIGDGNYLSFKSVIFGQYNEANNGIDLIGVTEKGEPVLIEVKKRSTSKRDSLGISNVQNDYFEKETIGMQNQIVDEYHKNFELLTRVNSRQNAIPPIPDPELSSEQFGKLWSRDRYFKAIKNKEVRENLINAGIASNFLDINRLSSNAFIPEWEKILNNRVAVIVSSKKDNVTKSVLRQAIFRKKINTTIIDLGS